MKLLAPAAILAALLAFAPSGRAAEPTRVEVTKDNSIVLLESELRDNAGAGGIIRIKGNQHMVAMMFDTKPLVGRVIESAELVCAKVDADIAGLAISTIGCDWDEMKSCGRTAGMPGVEGWGYAGARFPAIAGGNACSLICQSPSVVKDGWYHWAVRPDLVQAIALGAAHGLTLHEWSGDYSRNPTIHSREQNAKKPYLLVTFADAAAEPKPEPPTGLKLTGGDLDSLRLHLKAPKTGFLYEVKVGDAVLPRWNIPFVRPGEEQVIPIRDVPLKGGEKIQVTTVGRTGLRSEPAAVASAAPAAEEKKLPEAAALASAGAPPDGLAVIPQEDKYDAAGKPVGALPADYLAKNEVFDGKTVLLRAAKGEVVGFQALLKGSGKVTVKCDLPGLRTDVFRAVYVACKGGVRIPDPLVALPPTEEIALSADEATPVLVDVFVPFDFKAAGAVEGTFTLSDGRKLPVRLEVRPFAIPREASFFCEMNGYGLPAKASEFYRLQEIAYDHRVHANILAYSHSSTAPGSNKSNYSMLLDSPSLAATQRGASAVRKMDNNKFNDIAPGAKQAYWDDFIAAFGPYLSGSCFKDGHRGPIAPPGFYLPFHESWPLKVREFSSGRPDACEAFKDKPVYSETYVNIMKDFLRVAREQGWTKAGFQVYLNNKGSLKETGKAPWILDEPVDTWDYRALGYYADLTHEARGRSSTVTLRFRIDISRPEFDRGQLWGKADFWVVATGAFHEYHRIVMDRAERSGEWIWAYGSSNDVEQTNRTTAAWVLDIYRGGGWGVVPWQTINSDGAAMQKADPLGLFIFMKGPDGNTVMNHSMRLKAYRRAEQDVEYLELLRKKLGLSPAEVARLIDTRVNLAGKTRIAYAEDAGTPEYGKITPESMRQLREGVAAALGR